MSTKLRELPDPTTKENISELFVELFNISYPGCGIEETNLGPDFSDTPDYDFTEENIKVTSKWTRQTAEIAHLKDCILSKGYYILGIHFDRWESMDLEQQLVTICHELVHINIKGHYQDFWDECLRIYDRVRDVLDNNYDIDWDLYNMYLVDDPMDSVNNPSIRNECIKKIENHTGYKSDWYIDLHFQRMNTLVEKWEEEKVYVNRSDIKTDDYSDKVLYEHYQALEKFPYGVLIPEILVRQTTDGVKVTHNEITAALLLRNGMKQIPVIFE